jgi:hypothetical protein
VAGRMGGTHLDSVWATAEFASRTNRERLAGGLRASYAAHETRAA